MIYDKEKEIVFKKFQTVKMVRFVAIDVMASRNVSFLALFCQHRFEFANVAKWISYLLN